MILVTGGLGFIGSHLVDQLLKNGEKVRVIDNLSTGRRSNLPPSKNLEIIEADICNPIEWIDDVKTIFHLAADPDVRSSVEDPSKSFKINVVGSFNLLESARQNNIKNFIFASSGGTVYGDTPQAISENSPLQPISPYGASKSAFEMYLSAYSHSYTMNCISLRLGNVIGPRSEHGVIWDFFHKLKKNPNQLEILGDGKQEKSYIHVSDTISAFLLTQKVKGFEAYNVANGGTLTVTQLAKLVAETMKLSPELKYTGGERGWVGDVKTSITEISKLKKLGWAPKLSQTEAVNSYVQYLLKTY